MAGELDFFKGMMDKTAAIPAEAPKWGTPHETDLPGEARPEGLDTNQPVGDDAQNTHELQARFSRADETEATMKATLRAHLANFDAPSRGSSSQLLKNQPKTNTRVYAAMGEALQRQLAP